MAKRKPKPKPKSPAKRKPKKKPAPKPPSSGLTPAEEAFVVEYLLSDNAVQSYRLAYPGTTYGSAKTLASRLLTKVDIKKEIAAARTDNKRRYRATAKKVIGKLSQLAFSDLGDVLDIEKGDPVLKARKDIPIEARRAIQSIAVTEHGVRVKMHDQVGALRQLFTHFGLSTEISSLDALLGLLPAELAAQIRQALAGHVPGGDDSPGSGGGAAKKPIAVRG